MSASLDPPPIDRRRRSRTLPWVFVVLGCVGTYLLVVCGFGGYGLLHRTKDPTVADLPLAVEEYRKTGLPWEAKDLRPSPPIPDGQNALPLLKKAFAVLDTRKFDSQFVPIKHLLDDGKWQGALLALKPFDQALGLAAKAGSRPRLDPGYDWDRGPYIAITEPKFLRCLGRAFALRAEVEALRGNASACTTDLTYSKRFASFIGDTHTLIGLLMEVGDDATLTDSAERSAIALQNDSSALVSILETLKTEGARKNLIPATRTEVYLRVFMARNIDQFRGIYANSEDPPKVDWSLIRKTGVPSNPADQAAMDRVLRFWIKAAPLFTKNKDDPIAFGEAIDALVSREASKISSANHMAQLDSWLLDDMNMKPAGEAIFRQEVNSIVAQAFVESLDYRRVHGQFPANASQISGGPWIDPYIKKPLHVISNGQTFRVYSVGPTLQDHGGKSQHEVSLKASGWKEFNIVAAFPPIRRTK